MHVVAADSNYLIRVKPSMSTKLGKNKKKTIFNNEATPQANKHQNTHKCKPNRSTPTFHLKKQTHFLKVGAWERLMCAWATKKME